LNPPNLFSKMWITFINASESISYTHRFL